MSATNSSNLCSHGLKPTPIATMMFKVHDLSHDVDCLKSSYDVSVDPNKMIIERVLSNMKVKLHKVDQTLKFGQSAMEYSVIQEKTAVALKRIRKLRELFKDLLKEQGNSSTPERRSLCQMFHQLLSMEDDLVHFADHGNISFGRCKNDEQPQRIPAKDCEVRAVLLDGIKPGMARSEDTKVSSDVQKRYVCCDYPEIEDSSDCGQEETRDTVFSIAYRREDQPHNTNYSVTGDNSDEITE